MKTLIKKLVRESLEIHENEGIDRILDKISAYGINSLTPHEKAILDSSSTGEKVVSPEKQAVRWLRQNFGQLNVDIFKKSGYGDDIYGFEFTTDDDEPIMYLEAMKDTKEGGEPLTNIRLVSKVFDKLINEFGLTNVQTDEVIKKWLTKQYLGKLGKHFDIFSRFTIRPFRG